MLKFVCHPGSHDNHVRSYYRLSVCDGFRDPGVANILIVIVVSHFGISPTWVGEYRYTATTTTMKQLQPAVSDGAGVGRVRRYRPTAPETD